MYGYIYETTFRNHPEWVYYGKHKSEDVDENYNGSGSVVVNYIKKYGSSSVSTKVISWHETKEELDQAEKEIIASGKEKFGRCCMNIADGGDGGAITNNFVWYTNGEIDIYLKESVKPPVGFSKGRSAIKGNPGSSGKTYINNGVENKLIPKDLLEEFLSSGWSKGMMDRGNSWRSNLSKVRVGVRLTDPHIRKIKESFERKRAESPNGKVYFGNNFKGHNTHNKGKISITNGITNKYIDKDSDIPDGWRIGNTQHRGKKKNVGTN